MTDQATAAMMEKAEAVATAYLLQAIYGDIMKRAGVRVSIPAVVNYAHAHAALASMYQNECAALASQAEIVGELVGALDRCQQIVERNLHRRNEKVSDVIVVASTTLAKARSAGL